MIRIGNNEVLKTLTKTLTFVDADAIANANANTGVSTIVLPERCSGELKKNKCNKEGVKASKYLDYSIRKLPSLQLVLVP